MQRLQRKAGVFLPRTADDAQVGLLLKDFDDGDKALKNIVEQAKAFRIAWTEILQRASGAAAEFETIYQFIAGDLDNDSQYRATDRQDMEKAKAFKEMLAQARDVVIQELGDVERRVAAPAKDARKNIEIYRKVIKKREDRKLDWERYKSRTEALEKKSSRSDRDNNALMKHQIDLEASSKAYEIADYHLKDTLPGLTKAIYALLPHLIYAQAMVQNTLFGHYYTALHEFCQQYGFPIPSSGFQETQSEFEDAFTPVKRETEALAILQKGRAVAMTYRSKPEPGQNTIPARNKLQPIRSNGTLPPPIPLTSPGLSPPILDYGSKPTRTTSNHSYTRPSPAPSVTSYQSSDYSTTRPSLNSHLSAPHVALARATSASSLTSAASSTTAASIGATAAAAAAVAAKKKPPPPPPPKRRPSALPPQDYVIAQYDFAGQGAGDLAFHEGDRIRVVKRTDSTNDWWEGECHGAQGSFPANYCKAA